MKRIVALPRRTVLKGAVAGATATVALPLLEAMLDSHGEALANGDALPLRFMTWFFGNGVRLDRFVPKGEGASYPLSEELAPLAKHRDYVSVLTGFSNHCHPDNKITHHEGMVIFSGYNNREVGEGDGFYSNAGGPTIDQVIAAAPGIGDATPITSVQVGVSKRESGVDFGTTMHNLSHAGVGVNLAAELDPKEVWSALFDSFVAPEDPQRALRLSVLDIVKHNAAALNKRLGSADKQRLAAHLQGIADLEKKIEALPPICITADAPSQTNEDVDGQEQLAKVNEVMSDLLVTAFQCDITRVASLLFNEGAGETVFADLGQTKAYHQHTHSESQEIQDKEVHEGVIYIMERFAYLLDRLDATPDGVNGTLLDNIAIFCSTDCEEGWSHKVDKQPMIVAGKAGGRLVHPGIHYASKTGENPTDVLLSLLQVFDPTALEVGANEPYSNTPLALIKAS